MQSDISLDGQEFCSFEVRFTFQDVEIGRKLLDRNKN